MKKTIKRQIVEFVISKGSAGRMEIVEFYIDLKEGEGHYQANKKSPTLDYVKDDLPGWKAVPHPTKTHNPFRGRLSSGFNKCFEKQQEDYIKHLESLNPLSNARSVYLIKKAWLMDESTKEFLVKGEDGKSTGVIKE